MAFIRSISGLRATLDGDLTPDVVTKYSAAFAHILPPGPIVIGRDGRPSGTWIEEVIVDTLTSVGRDVRILGMVPTPTVQLHTEHSDAAGGIVITASHNPSQWNGLKFLDNGGVFLDGDANAELWHSVDTASYSTSDESKGNVQRVVDARTLHINSVCDIPIVKSAPLSGGEVVVVDAVNASGSHVVPELLELFGYRVIKLYCDGSGVFPHTPEPVSENLVDLGEAVRANEAAFGVAVDPDADRLVLLDHNGEPIGEELTISLATLAVLSAGERNGDAVVVNYSTTRVVDDVAAQHGARAYRAAVGEINVVRKMQSLNAVIGGEGSGGVIFPACHAGRDSLVGIGLITSYLRRQHVNLRAAVEQLPSYAMIKTKFELPNRDVLPTLIERASREFADATLSTEDGLHAAMSDRWVHVRGSNTEPIVRVIAEAPTHEIATELVERVAAIVRAILKST